MWNTRRQARPDCSASVRYIRRRAFFCSGPSLRSSSIAAGATRGSRAWVSSYFVVAERVLVTERHVAEQWVRLGNAWITPRRRRDPGAPLRTV